MVQFTALLSTALMASSLLAPVIAHPGVHEPDDLQKRSEVWSHAKRSVADCTNSLKGRSMMKRAAERRSLLANSLREKRGLTNKPMLHRRDFATHANTTHNSNLTDISPNVDPDTLFTGNLNCVLAPEVTQGPYFVTGEYVRNDVKECQEGVDVFLDMQFINVNTCEPVPSIYLDIWHANATGVYSGIVAEGNGDSSDLTNLDSTFLRGLAATNDDGVVQFNTIFPGHYVGRATHIHVVAHTGGLQNLNGTYSGGNITHVGQLFFDEDLRTAVETLEPYTSNTQTVTSNLEDMWAIVADEGEDGTSDFDPFVEYAYLGEDASEGILAWVSIGIDPEADNSVSHAATLTEDGGVVNSDSEFGGGNGTMPSGGVPSGAMPSGTGIPIDIADSSSSSSPSSSSTSEINATSEVASTFVTSTSSSAQVSSVFTTPSTTPTTLPNGSNCSTVAAGNWCAKPIQSFSSKTGCKQSVTTCKSDVSSCTNTNANSQQKSKCETYKNKYCTSLEQFCNSCGSKGCRSGDFKQ